jgi:hypothetical protein
MIKALRYKSLSAFVFMIGLDYCVKRIGILLE